MTTAAIPPQDRVTQQRRDALQRANQVRLPRAALRHRLATGEVSAGSVILDCPPEAQTWPIFELLLAQARWGTRRARTFCSRHHVAETKPVGALTDRQRAELAGALEAVNGGVER